MAQGGVSINTDGSVADGSAMLDVESTDKGFLPPRMTEAQRNLISNPVAGLVVWCIDCTELQVYNGTTWTNMTGGDATSPPDIGDFMQGGVVFYIDGNGGGLVCAVSDQSSSAQWGCYGNPISGADGTDIGTGSQNTLDIEADCTDAGIAADLCANLSLNGFDDWFLPSKDELVEMYNNKAAINTTALANGGAVFADSYYWSSSEYDDNRASAHWFDGGYEGTPDKLNPYYVRAVRAF